MNSQKPSNAYADMRRSATILAQDAMRLADLQIQLLVLDITEFWYRARFGIALAVIGIAILLGTLPIFILSIAEFVHANSQLSEAASEGIVAVIAVGMGGIALWASLRRLTQAGESLQHSQVELRANIDWLRSVINRDDE